MEKLLDGKTKGILNCDKFYR